MPSNPSNNFETPVSEIFKLNKDEIKLYFSDLNADSLSILSDLTNDFDNIFKIIEISGCLDNNKKQELMNMLGKIVEFKKNNPIDRTSLQGKKIEVINYVRLSTVLVCENCKNEDCEKRNNY